jgi:hypothetical protein
MPRHEIWLQKLDEWFALNNIHRILSLVAKKGAMIAARPADSNTMQLDSSGTDVNISTARPQPTTNSGCPPATNVPGPSSVGEDAMPQPQQKPRRNVTIEDVPVRVKRAEHVIQGAPKTFEVVDR